MTTSRISGFTITKIDRDIKSLISRISQIPKDISEYDQMISKINELKSMRHSIMETKTYKKMIQSLL